MPWGSWRRQDKRTSHLGYVFLTYWVPTSVLSLAPLSVVKPNCTSTCFPWHHQVILLFIIGLKSMSFISFRMTKWILHSRCGRRLVHILRFLRMFVFIFHASCICKFHQSWDISESLIIPCRNLINRNTVGKYKHPREVLGNAL